MEDSKIEIYLGLRLAKTVSLDYLLREIMDNRSQEEARRQLRLIASRAYVDADPSDTALTHLGGMLAALDEQEFRALDLAPPPAEAFQLRSERITQYSRHRQLFLLELALCRRIKRNTMAASQDWSPLEGYTREGFSILKARAMFRLAGWMYRWHIPGGQDMADAAAYVMFRLLYAAPVKNLRASAS